MMPQSAQTSEPLLDGLVIVELGNRIATGACGGLLAGLGANVVFVEPANPGDHGKWRHRAAMAAGKRSVILERNDAEDQLALAGLLDVADVVLLSSDVSAHDLRIWEGDRPHSQIICDITAFGHTGPLAGQKFPESLVQAIAGIADTTGRRDGKPAITGAPFLDMETAAYATAAILAALRGRRQFGFGQRIDMALYDVAVNALLTFIPLHFVGRPAMRNGNRHPTLAPWNAYRGKDDWVLICAPTNDQWRRLCAAMERPDLADDARYATPTLRLDAVDDIDVAIGAWAAMRTVADCVARVSAQGIPCSPIVAIGDLAAEPNLRHRNMVRELRDPLTGGTVRVPASPIRIAGEPTAGPNSVPAQGGDAAATSMLATSKKRETVRVQGDPSARERSLAGVRIVEIGMNTVAPLACRQLGALGADVIKVEPPAGDSNRINAPLREDGESYIFALSNTDKRGVVLDLRQTADQDTLIAMLATADVVIENLKPGSLAKLGFSSADMLKRFPRLIYCSVNGFGYDTVYPGRPALDTVIQGMSGAMSATPVDGVPTKAGISISDQLGGQFGLVAILAALDWRERSGRGLHLDLAMQDCTAWATQTLWNSQPGGSQTTLVVPAVDGYVALVGDAGVIAAELGPSAAQTRDDIVRRFVDIAGCAAAPVLTVGEVVAHPQTAARDLLREVPTANGDSWRVLGSPLRLLATPALVRSAMPRLGTLDPALAREFDLRPAPTGTPVRADAAADA